MKEKVYFIPVPDPVNDQKACGLLRDCIAGRGLLDFLAGRDMVAVKTHFGEYEKNGVAPALYLKMLGALVRDRKALPFLTETQTLYKGSRTNAVLHLNHAQAMGYGYEQTGLPIIMADGLFGDEEVEVTIPGKLHGSVKMASAIVKANALVAVSHFTGHMTTGFGCALKNLGMGCSSRKGKMNQHSTTKPSVNTAACTGCGACVQWCPASAVSLKNGRAVIDGSLCIGCGQCLAVCRFDAVNYNWGASYEDLQKSITEHAWGVAIGKKDRMLFVNFLTRITRDCDCTKAFERIAPDIGIVVAHDPVAADAASLDIVEERTGKKFSQIAYQIPYRYQIDYAAEIGFGNPDYDLIAAGGK